MCAMKLYKSFGKFLSGEKRVAAAAGKLNSSRHSRVFTPSEALGISCIALIVDSFCFVIGWNTALRRPEQRLQR